MTGPSLLPGQSDGSTWRFSGFSGHDHRSCALEGMTKHNMRVKTKQYEPKLDWVMEISFLSDIGFFGTRRVGDKLLVGFHARLAFSFDRDGKRVQKTRKYRLRH